MGEKMKINTDYVRGIGIGLVAAGGGAIIGLAGDGYGYLFLGLCALGVGYIGVYRGAEGSPRDREE